MRAALMPRSPRPMRERERRSTTAPVSVGATRITTRSEEHTSELQSLMRISYAVFCLKKKTTSTQYNHDRSNIVLLLNTSNDNNHKVSNLAPITLHHTN